jgi:hypothetical protein
MITQAQSAALLAYLKTVPEMVACAVAKNDVCIASHLNAASSFIVWKTSVDPDEIMRNGMDWTRVDNLTTGKARIWDWLTRLGTFDASKPNIRAGIDAAWVGTAADLAVRATVYTHCKRAATVAESVLATGAGTTAMPGTMTFEGEITTGDVVGIVWNDDGSLK